MRPNTIFKVLLPIFVLFGLTACRTPEGDTVAQKRAHVRTETSEALKELYVQMPEAKKHVERAPGYAIFTNISRKIGFVASGQGFGIAVDNRTGKRTFMLMKEYGAGFGVGLEDYRAVYVFNNKATFDEFLVGGWGVTGDAGAAVKSGESGAAVGLDMSEDQLTQDVTVYEFTEAGVALSVVASGTKYYPDEELN